MKEYHTNLSKWFRRYVIYLTDDINEDDFWKKHKFANSPGWNLMHLIVEGELALKRINPAYTFRSGNHESFEYGSDGRAVSDMSKQEILELFKEVYAELDSTVVRNIESLYEKPNTDEILKDLLKTELDSCLHMLTTHVAMHCSALTKWRQMEGLNI